jgi:predicted AAA+ superfamily ATPase
MIRDFQYKQLVTRLEASRKCIQVLIGPRQVGKTTLINQATQQLDMPVHYVSADAPGLEDSVWLTQQWQKARAQLVDAPEALLVVDEIQKIDDWPDWVKKFYDEDTRAQRNLKVVLLGSSPLLIQQGLTESLAGRFEVINLGHWSFNEMREAFDINLDQYIYFGAYPGAAEFINDEPRWRDYINNSLIETTISRDILLMTNINKPALLRRLFQLGCHYSGQILSYQKMLGQLHDAGNTTTLAHYLTLLKGAGMLCGLQKYSGKKQRLRGSIPKLQVLNTALMSAQHHYSFAEAKENKQYWGRLVESAVGACLLNDASLRLPEVMYWREANKEIDFVFEANKKVIGLEVKSGDKKTGSGLSAFQKVYSHSRLLQVGGDGVALEDFFTNPEYFLHTQNL